MKIGIFFGGASREREISFAGGRTIYDNLDKTLFEPVPIFVDSYNNFVLLDWQYIYKGSIRDFYPPTEFLDPNSPFQIYAESLHLLTQQEQDQLIEKIGRRIAIEELPQLMDFAFLALHGTYGEDGSIQGLLQFLGIPYTASGILPSAIGMDKAFQKNMMVDKGFAVPNFHIIARKNWLNPVVSRQSIYQNVQQKVGMPCVVKPANQGSSIGVGRLMDDDFAQFEAYVEQAFFIQKITETTWQSWSKQEQIDWMKSLVDIRSGLGLPLSVQISGAEKSVLFHHPDALLSFIQQHFKTSNKTLILAAADQENEVLVESFLTGKEFSCIVLRQDDGKVTALPPTEIRKGKEIYDYRSKYLPGLSRKITPIHLPNEQIEAIRVACEQLFGFFKFNTYARIDGFIQEDGTIYLNDPNTTSGMLPSSFFFHQAAEIGLNPSQFLTFIIRSSLQERIHTTTNNHQFSQLLNQLDQQIIDLQQQATQKIKVGVVLGGYSSERHISVESGRNIYEKLASSHKYSPIPIFLTGDDENYQLYEIPINVLLKDNADDIKEKINYYEKHPVVESIKQQCSDLIQKYVSGSKIEQPNLLSIEALVRKVDAVFIALHGRPGEDGRLQQDLIQYNMPFNGSGVASSQITIDKYATNQLLSQHGFKLAQQLLVQKKDWLNDSEKLIQTIESRFAYPFIAKPSDDGCSSAVKKIKHRQQLKAFIALIFRTNALLLPKDLVDVLELQAKEEFPVKDYFLIEELIHKGNAQHFLEVTGGLLTHHPKNGESIVYEMFEPSETLATSDVLSLEEKFLAGQGQNITPARYAPTKKQNQQIAHQVKTDLKKAAQLLNIEGYARIDAFVKIHDNQQVETNIIEVNSLPGMTPATCIFHQTALNGYTPYQFIDKILDYAMKK